MLPGRRKVVIPRNAGHWDMAVPEVWGRRTGQRPVVQDRGTEPCPGMQDSGMVTFPEVQDRKTEQCPKFLDRGKG